LEADITTFESDCRSQLDQFFAKYSNAAIQTRAMQVLRLLRASDRPLKGKAEGWAAGIIYFAATYDRPPVGIPDLLNDEFEAMIGVSMETARRRAARIRELVTL